MAPPKASHVDCHPKWWGGRNPADQHLAWMSSVAAAPPRPSSAPPELPPHLAQREPMIGGETISSPSHPGPLPPEMTRSSTIPSTMKPSSRHVLLRSWSKRGRTAWGRSTRPGNTTLKRATRRSDDNWHCLRRSLLLCLLEQTGLHCP